MCLQEDIKALLEKGAKFGVVHAPEERRRGLQHEIFIKFCLVVGEDEKGHPIRRHFQVSITSGKKEDLSLEDVSAEEMKGNTGMLQQSLNNEHSFFLLAVDMDPARIMVTGKTLLGIAYLEYFPGERGTVLEEVSARNLPRVNVYGKAAPKRKHGVKRFREGPVLPRTI